MRESRLPLSEKIPAAYIVQVVKTQIHNQRVCEDTNFLRDRWATGRRAKKVIVYYTIEDQLAVSVEAFALHCLILTHTQLQRALNFCNN
jgi:hypothetical protein